MREDRNPMKLSHQLFSIKPGNDCKTPDSKRYVKMDESNKLLSTWKHLF